MNASRITSYAFVVFVTLLAGCVSYGHRGPHHFVNVDGRQLMLRVGMANGVPVLINDHGGLVRTSACSDGWRQINGRWICMGNSLGAGNRTRRGHDGYITCNIKVRQDSGEVLRTTVPTTPAGCDELEGFIEDVRQRADDEVEPIRATKRDVDGPRHSRDEHRKPDVQESVIPAKGENDTCRLRVRGKVIAEVDVPTGSDSKKYCDDWQRGEARKRGLL